MLRSILHQVSLLILTALSGCAAVGAIAYKTMPEPPVPAAYRPDQTPVLVIAESKSSDAMTQLDGDRLSRLVTKEFYDYQIAPTIDPDALVALRDRLLSKYNSQSMQSIGEQVGADQVLYIELLNVGIGTAPGSDVVRCLATAQVRMVDVESGYVVYPEGATSGQQVTFQTRPMRITSEMSPASLRGQVLDGLAHNIVKLFRDWRPSEEPSDLGVE